MIQVITNLTKSNFTFKMPAGGYWDDPGMPSLMVPYGIASDFYYSGHTGYLVIATIEQFYIDKSNWKMIACMACTACYMITIILLFKIHYVIGRLHG